MPSPVLLASESVAGQTTFLRDIRPGKYDAFYLKLSGDAVAATTLLENEFGRVELMQAGAPLVTVDYDVLHDINELKKGGLRIRADAGLQHEWPVVIPRNYWFDDNVHQVNQGDQVQVRIQYGTNFGVVFAAGQTAIQKVYGMVRETGLMAYNLKMSQINKVYSSGVFTEEFGFENVLAVYFVQNAGNTDRVRVTKDGKEMANVAIGTNAAGIVEEDLLEISDWYNSKHGATDAIPAADTSRIGEVDVADNSAIDEFLSDDVEIEFTVSGTTFTQQFVIMHADFTDTKLRQTKAENASITQRKIARKQQKGRTRPVRVLEELAV